MTRIVAGVGLDLRAQLAGRNQDQGAQRPRPFEQTHQDRQQECGGLAAPGLRGGDQIVAGKNHGDGAELDGCGLGIADGAHTAHDGLGEPEGTERH